jgi:hypothetical protein
MRGIELPEWRLKANYLAIAFHVTSAQRIIVNDLATRSFLQTCERRILEQIWDSCMERERAGIQILVEIFDRVLEPRCTVRLANKMNGIITAVR